MSYEEGRSRGLEEAAHLLWQRHEYELALAVLALDGKEPPENQGCGRVDEVHARLTPLPLPWPRYGLPALAKPSQGAGEP